MKLKWEKEGGTHSSKGKRNSYQITKGVTARLEIRAFEYDNHVILEWCFKSITACKKIAQAIEDGE